MKDSRFRSKQLALVIGMSLLTVFILCAEFLLSQGATPLSAPVKQAVDAPMAPSSTMSSAAPRMSFPISVKEFLERNNFNYLTDDSTDAEALGYLPIAQSMRTLHLEPTDAWTPTEILGYAESSLDLPHTMNADSKLYITSKSKDQIEVNLRKWDTKKNQTQGDANSAAKTYRLSDDADIWLRIGSMGFFRIPASDLDAYIKTDYGKMTLWSYAIENGKIISLVEHYVP